MEVTNLKGIGAVLQKERESRNITLEQVETATKIRRKYLEAIEREAFEILPGEVYVKGFVATYLKYLGIKDRPDVIEIMKPKIEPKEQSEEVEIVEQVPEPEVSHNLQRSKKENKKVSKKTSKKEKEVFEEPPLTKNTKMILFISIAAILVLFLLQGIYSAGQPKPNEDQQQIVGNQDLVHDEALHTPNIPEEPVVPTTPQYDGLEMTLEILDLDASKVEKCWMKITVDGKATELNLTEGQIQQVHAAEQIDLHLGNAGVVNVTLNGQDLGTLGAQGKVVKQSFRLSDYNSDTVQ